ncbi:hypothetical protein [Niastella sp. OAS944]|uniref:hypothetical protein n=1 Tax=Niastella sp. OAS944 TaxID=2664089 RepID=UPI003477C131|nr:hypothetical protein [Chitinophagaceae bacterium OAS944]
MPLAFWSLLLPGISSRLQQIWNLHLQFHITQKGIMYLGHLENNPSSIPVQINSITLGNIHSPVQLQQASSQSNQHLVMGGNSEAILELLTQLEKDIKKVDSAFQADFQTEIDYARKQLGRSKSPAEQLGNIGSLIKDVGINVLQM